MNRTWGWHARGQRHVRAAIAKLVALGMGGGDDPDGAATTTTTTLVFGGESAGARGALVWLEHVRALVPRSVRVVALLDTPHPFHDVAPRTGANVGDYSPENTMLVCVAEPPPPRPSGAELIRRRGRDGYAPPPGG